MHIRSFKLKLLFSFACVILVCFGLVSYFLYKNLEENTLKDIKTTLLNEVYLIESLLPRDIINNPAYLEDLVKDLSKKINSRITIIDKSGKVLADSEKDLKEIPQMENHASRPEVKVAISGQTGEAIRYSSTLKMDMLYIALPVKENESVKAVIRLALPLSGIKIVLGRIRKEILFSIFFVLGLAFVFISLLAEGISRPIKRIIYASRRFAEGDFRHKIYASSKDEIGQLAVILNKMASSIEEKISQIEIQNQQLKNIFQGMVEGIITVDKQGRIVSVNPAVEKIFNINSRDIEGRPLLEVIRNNELAEIVKQAMDKRGLISQELVLTWPAQKIFKINASALFEKEMVIGCLLVIHDISQIRQLENIRRDFVANVSHELKTPLTSIKGFVETLIEGAWDDKENARNFLLIIQDHVNRLDNLIRDLLSLSYLESKEVVLHKEKVVLKVMVDEILAGFKSQLKKKSVEAKNSINPDLSVMADRDKLEQVFTNLIDNAIKFNRENSAIKIYAQDADKDIKVTVEDSGIGIPAKDIPRIFERFYRVDKTRSREMGGTGLGLSIVKHIVELHGGSVGAESTEGLGSKFWFTLPK
ncbi:MAG: cell wall metabolism sensor histidine kinase WalK [Candidatus Omnitrophica bacterium]|nr:cell wall metabolism sensor histidine kinase WalK [Candidatus Omnitrophota bacterium]